MRKTCKCGFQLSDTIVPNNVIHWTYPANEKVKLERKFYREYPDVTQIAIWHCEKCGRFYYWGKDWKHYTYNLCDESVIKVPDIDWESDVNMYYSFNDFEDESMRQRFKSERVIEFPRKVYVNDKQDLIVVNKSGEYKYYCLESVQEMTRPD